MKPGIRRPLLAVDPINFVAYWARCALRLFERNTEYQSISVRFPDASPPDFKAELFVNIRTRIIPMLNLLNKVEQTIISGECSSDFYDMSALNRRFQKSCYTFFGVYSDVLCSAYVLEKEGKLSFAFGKVAFYLAKAEMVQLRRSRHTESEHVAGKVFKDLVPVVAVEDKVGTSASCKRIMDVVKLMQFAVFWAGNVQGGLLRFKNRKYDFHIRQWTIVPKSAAENCLGETIQQNLRPLLDSLIHLLLKGCFEADITNNRLLAQLFAEEIEIFSATSKDELPLVYEKRNLEDLLLAITKTNDFLENAAFLTSLY